ncbi:uncharacterized protein MONBRDRAFT_24286 [Monosiga brevicollis MX1]|uniref:Uncharacterized protein n=1 Tax=Monosiga brevicollis TaxID=81824 RepID=A9UVY8_MONBE|nr:uncharacterized protein MONBRDRAFT_24286 [Monosiga brevicollis MX1]EDQ90471.1 predicted protein [Monosiga brevicollis MX1]|eukprot:XP_001744522.1 hypothetical protein [Monosiga brevicollis MX1]
MAGRLVTIMLALLGCAMSLKVQLELDSNLPAAVGPRVAELVAQTGAQLVTSNADVVWSCGNTSYSHLVSADIEKLGPEGYTVRAFLHQSPQLVVAAGRAPTPLPYDRHYAQVAGRGDAYACYAALQMAGFAFLHPLTPIVPESLNVSAIANTSSSPRWPLRGFHIHTQHPLELTDLLTGFDLTANGTVLETWEAMQPDMALLAEWCLANLQNRYGSGISPNPKSGSSLIEWLPLWARDWGSFALGPIRQGRLLNLTKVVRGFGLHAGADAAIALQQQHAFALVNSTSDLSLAPASIASRMQWLAEAGFDFLSTENGFSEFTHPECSLMLDWINITAQQAAANQMTAYIKVHISSGQVCPNYTDPMSGGPINFNYLPIFADDRMGVMPHTVQYYNYEDPANTYGNVNFTSMFDFLFYALETNRSVVYHPETAYWINYDSSVPLFLPIYAYGRVSDLRFIKAHEQRVNKTMAGQMDFDSGWEWGYWLQDVITARSAWDVCGPADGCASDQDALAKALTPVVQPFGSAAEDLRQLLLRFIKDQRELLIFGNYSGAVLPTDDTGYVKLNGQAYMQGWDPYSEIPAIVDPIDSVQPVKLGFDAIWMGEEPDYWTKVCR